METKPRPPCRLEPEESRSTSELEPEKSRSTSELEPEEGTRPKQVNRLPVSNPRKVCRLLVSKAKAETKGSKSTSELEPEESRSTSELEPAEGTRPKQANRLPPLNPKKVGRLPLSKKKKGAATSKSTTGLKPETFNTTPLRARECVSRVGGARSFKVDSLIAPPPRAPPLPRCQCWSPTVPFMGGLSQPHPCNRPPATTLTTGGRGGGNGKGGLRPNALAPSDIDIRLWRLARCAR